MTDKMTAAPGRTLRDSAAMRWTALAVVAFTMMAAYYVNDVMAPLQEMRDGAVRSSDFLPEPTVSSTYFC